jgi:hypothetical protein
MSERKAKTVRLSEDLCKWLEEETKKKGPNYSENQIIEDAIRHYSTCNHLDQQGQMRLIVLRYSDSCLKCKRAIEVGEFALWSRGIGAICIDCYVQRFGDKSIIAKFLKVRELDQTRKALLHECDKLADKFEVLTLGEKWDQILQADPDLRRIARDFLIKDLGTPDEKKAFEDFLNLLQKLQELARQFEQLLEKQYQIKRKRISKALMEV